jgi:hypothetical protein
MMTTRNRAWYCRRMDTKTCKSCKQPKPVDDFYTDVRVKDGHVARCKPCHNAMAMKRYGKLPPEMKKIRMARARFAKYGMTLEEAEAMAAEQNGGCYLCGNEQGIRNRGREKSGASGLTMDHDHATGKPRRLLCSECNMTIGTAKDDPDLLERMAEYVRRFR